MREKPKKSIFLDVVGWIIFIGSSAAAVGTLIAGAMADYQL